MMMIFRSWCLLCQWYDATHVSWKRTSRFFDVILTPEKVLILGRFPGFCCRTFACCRTWLEHGEEFQNVPERARKDVLTLMISFTSPPQRESCMTVMFIIKRFSYSTFLMSFPSVPRCQSINRSHTSVLMFASSLFAPTFLSNKHHTRHSSRGVSSDVKRDCYAALSISVFVPNDQTREVLWDNSNTE